MWLIWTTADGLIGIGDADHLASYVGYSERILVVGESILEVWVHIATFEPLTEWYQPLLF